MKNMMRHATAFISSTFSDMINERNLMMFHVLPRVKKWAFDRGIIFDIVDLRWGINDEQARDLHHTIKICLKKVQESDPLFVCFLGERYGWIPGEQDFHQGMFSKDIGEYKERSATELEIIQAMESAFFDSPPKSCVFLFRKQPDFNGVPHAIREIYEGDEHDGKLAALKQAITRNYSAIEYSATFNVNDPSYPLHDFCVGQTPLEDELFEKLTAILCEKYQLNRTMAVPIDDILTRQKYYLHHTAMFQRIDACHHKLNEHYSQTGDFAISLIGIPRGEALSAQIAQFIIEKQTVQPTMYRFMGGNKGITTANDLIASFAYELSGDRRYLGDPIRSLFYVKTELESRNTLISLFIVGVTADSLASCFNMLRGLKFGKVLIFMESEHPETLPYSIDYPEGSFKTVANYLFAAKAKVLTCAQLDRILEFTEQDYSLLKLVITYLCTFATYETLDTMIGDLTKFDNLALTKQYIDNLVAVQNQHYPTGIMDNVLDILCNTPVSLTIDDIVDAILIGRYKDCGCTPENVRKEVEFSLAFAREYIEEYQSRYNINDEAIKSVVMFDRMPGASKLLFLPKNSILMIALRTVYEVRLYRKCLLDRYAARNFSEIVKDYSTPEFRRTFLNRVLRDRESFYALACGMEKAYLVDLMKTLSMQSLGHDVESYFAKEMKKRMNLTENPISFSQSIMKEKIFSVSRKTHPENAFLYYYSMVMAINERALSSFDSFCAFLDSYVPDVADTPYHKLQLPECFHITSANTTCFTTLDRKTQSRRSYYCHCGNGFAVIGDIFTGEMKHAFAFARDVGKICSVFYQDKTIHIIFEEGVLTQIDLLEEVTQTYRFEEEGVHVASFVNYYDGGYQLAAVNGNTVRFYRAMRRVGSISFKEGMDVLRVFEASAARNGLKRLLVLLKVADHRVGCYLFNLETSKITFAYTLYANTIVDAVQDRQTGEVYLQLDNEVSVTLTYDGKDTIDLNPSFDQVYFSSGSNCVLSKKMDGGIYFNDELIAGEENVGCCFASEKMVGFISKQNTLYSVDRGY